MSKRAGRILQEKVLVGLNTDQMYLIRWAEENILKNRGLEPQSSLGKGHMGLHGIPGNNWISRMGWRGG